MRTKLFLAFVMIIFATLVSTMVFASLILKDFDSYAHGVKEDQIYWIIASVEGGYKDGKWDEQILSESIHWAMMMGLDIKILDMQHGEVIHSHHVMESLSPGMKRRMEELFRVDMDTDRKYDEFPIISNGSKIGTLLARSFQKKALAEKEAIFEGRVRHFLYTYLLIAGAGSLFIGLMLTQYLSKPVRLLKKASEKIAAGDFAVRIAAESTDEVGDLANTFNKMAASLDKEETLRKRLMSNIAHELRTPLTIMKTHVEAMADGIMTDRSKGLEIITNEIERLITLVKGIEDMTAAEASFFTRGERVEIDLKEFLSGIVGDLTPLFNERGLFINIAEKNSLVVSADVEKLERILRNILSNALKFTEKGGVSIDYGAEGGRFFVDITDTGRGMAENDLPHIFDRFYRSGEPGVEGLGLGLSIVKELVDIMEGEITVKSTPGKGTGFRLLLPSGDR
ncbi:MAG: HAMP domain-containing sensor histidine kinase [Dissulfurispiraceae bacterium]|jgi:two-component system sensor histidine kinase BaeS